MYSNSLLNSTRINRLGIDWKIRAYAKSKTCIYQRLLVTILIFEIASCRTASRSLCLRGSWRAPRSTVRSLLSSLRCARGQIEREVFAPGWMEGRSGTVVVLATGIDPSPLVLPPLYPPLLAYPLLLYPRFTPFFPSPSHFSPLLCPPHSLMHSSAHIQRR